MSARNRYRSTFHVLSVQCWTLLLIACDTIASAATAPSATATPAAPPSVPLAGLSSIVFFVTALSAVAIPVALFVYFIRVFNVDLATTINESTTKALDKMVQFCYIFMFTAFVLLLSPFVILLVLPTGIVNSIYSNMFSSPLAFVIGCVADQNPEHVLWELICQQPGPPKNEWLVNIGGYVWAPTPLIVVNTDATLDAGGVPLTTTTTDGSIPFSSTTTDPPTAGASDAEKPLGERAPVSGGSITPGGGAVSKGAGGSRTPKAMVSPMPAASPVRIGSDSKPSKLSQPWYTYANQSSLGNSFPMAMVSGGITVPFYFILVALFGASISMTQKIPDFQAQLAEGSLSPPQVRKGLTIQVLQFVSAPFLATIAYAFFGPTGQTATITVAFVAGFSSQTILTSLLAAMNGFEAKVKPDVQANKVQETPAANPAQAAVPRG